jgi:hypothetical protein
MVYDHSIAFKIHLSYNRPHIYDGGYSHQELWRIGLVEKNGRESITRWDLGCCNKCGLRYSMFNEQDVVSVLNEGNGFTVYLTIDLRKNIVSFRLNEASEEHSFHLEKLFRYSDRMYPCIIPPSNSTVSISITIP